MIASGTRFRVRGPPAPPRLPKGFCVKYRSLAAATALLTTLGLPTLAQAQQDNRHPAQAAREQERRATPQQLLRSTLTDIHLEQVPAQTALDMWSLKTEIPLVINWNALEAEGIDPDAPVTLNLKRVPAQTALELILRQMHPHPVGDDKLIVQSTRWYVRILTRGEALQHSVTKLYFIGDLLMEIPNFAGPNVDLGDALSNTGAGGAGSGTGFIGDNNDDDRPEDNPASRAEWAEVIMDLVRSTIEPEIWDANGGEHASVRYFRNMLVVSAPEYVHEQIGVPTPGPRSRPAANPARDRRADRDGNTDNRRAPRRARRNTRGISGTTSGPNLVR